MRVWIVYAFFDFVITCGQELEGKSLDVYDSCCHAN